MPVVVYSLMRNILGMFHGPIVANDQEGIEKIKQAAEGKVKADLEGEEVLEALKESLLNK